MRPSDWPEAALGIIRGSCMKAHELARELGISQKELVNFLQQRRLTCNPTGQLAAGTIEACRSAFKPASVAVKIEPNGERKAVLPPTLTVKDLAEKLGVSPVEVIKKLMTSNIMATINQVIDFATAEIVADEFGFTVEPVKSEDVVTVESAKGEGDVVTTSREELFSLANEDPSKLMPRPPIVTVLGHVDHGKTSILDSIRKTHVATGEAGGITQRIGAYKIETADGHPVVFIDTPGHEAFTAMRARGAQVTDLVVLVVAADDGVMPQTIEAIQHARAAKVPIVVAINKIDKDNANVDRVRSVTEAEPATPVVVSGMSEVPQAGDIFQVVGSEKAARQIALTKLMERRTQEAAKDFAPRITLEELARRAKEGEVKELSLVVKADAQGTLEAVLAALQKIEDPVVAIKIVGQGVGAVSDSDLLLASVSSAIIVCFNLKPTPASTAAAERAKVEVRYYDVIYKLTEDVERAAKGLREPTYRQVYEGRAEVIMPIRIPRLGTIAGSRVVDGKISRGSWVKLSRGREQLFEGRISSLKHFKEDVREMPAGQECGIGLEGWEDFQPADTIETYRLEREEI